MVVSLCNLLEVLTFIICLHYLYDENVKWDVMTLGLVVTELCLMQIVYALQLNWQWVWLIYIVIIIYSLIKFEKKLRSAVVNCIICVVLIGIVQTTLMLFLYLIVDMQMITEKESLIINGLMLLMMIFGVKKSKLNKLAIALQSNEIIIAVASLVMIISVTYCLLNYRDEEGLSSAYYFILIISVMLVVIVGIDFWKHKFKAIQAERELQVYKLYEKSFQNLIEDICARQHEFDNHINTIYSQHYLHHTYDALVEAQKKYCKDIVQANSFNKLPFS